MNRKPEYWADEGEFNLTELAVENGEEVVVMTNPRHLDGRRFYRLQRIGKDLVVEQKEQPPTHHVRRYLRLQGYEVVSPPVSLSQTTLREYEPPQQHATG